MTERDPSRPTPGTSDSESEASIEAVFDGSASAASALREAAGPSDEQFEQMFGDLLLEAREGRLSKEEMMQAMTERMQTFQSSIEAGPHTTEQAKRLLSVEMDECVAVLMKDGMTSAPDERMPDITEATFAALNSIISGKPSSPEQRAKWPRGLGDVLAADPVATAKFLYDAEGTKAFCLAFASVENARASTTVPRGPGCRRSSRCSRSRRRERAGCAPPAPRSSVMCESSPSHRRGAGPQQPTQLMLSSVFLRRPCVPVPP